MRLTHVALNFDVHLMAMHVWHERLTFWKSLACCRPNNHVGWPNLISKHRIFDARQLCFLVFQEKGDALKKSLAELAIAANQLALKKRTQEVEDERYVVFQAQRANGEFMKP